VTVISSAIASLVPKAITSQTTASQAYSSQNAGSNFGPAANITLSASAQSAVTSQGSSSGNGASTASTGNSAPTAPAGVGGGSSAISTGSNTSTSSSETSELVEEAKRKVIPQVGIKGADEVVDNQGNINEVKLHELIAQQDTRPTRQSLSVTT